MVIVNDKERKEAIQKAKEMEARAFERIESIKQLLIWPEAVRGTPNAFLRSALFPAIKPEHRKAIPERTLIASQRDVTVRYTGWQLSQADLDVWEEAVHRTRITIFKDKAYFSARDFLRALGRSGGKSNHEWLKNSITRLLSGAIEVKYDKRVYAGSLLEEFSLDEVSGLYSVTINSKLAKLFKSGYTSIDWEQRKALMRKPLAQWLHSYYSSHDRPHDVRVATLHMLCGSNTKQLYAFRQKLKAALDELVTVGLLKFWSIEDDLVQVTKVSKPKKNEEQLPPAK